ncbi:MAG: lytic transglycosylase domain-containing protein [Pseudomonadota bacterium]
MHIVRRPKAGDRRLGNIRRLVPEPEPALPGGGMRRAGPQDWFWKIHQTELTAAAPTRWGAALGSLRTRRASGNEIVSSAMMDRIVRRYGSQITAAAERHTVSSALIAAVIAVESAGKPTAISHAGAQGLMQLIPATAARFGVANSYDPAENVLGGAAYLSWLLNRFRQDPILALAGYNAGEGAVDKHDGVPPFRETRDYVVKVFDALAALESLCIRPPVTPRHPCDWRVASR